MSEAGLQDEDRPLDVLLGLGPRTRDDVIAADVAFEEQMRRCMALEGFEYSMQTPESIQWSPGWGLGVEDYVVEHGYGIVSSAIAALESAAEPPADPNAESVATLSDAERQALVAALDRCFDETIELRRQPPEIERLVPEALELEQWVMADARVVAEEAVWAACMAAAGFEYKAKGDPIAFVRSRVGEIVEDSQPVDDRNRTLLIRRLLDEVQREELDLAAHDLSCSQRYREVVGEVTREHHLRFIETHSDVLDQN